MTLTVGSLAVNRYKVLEKLGEGAFGAAYLAEDRKLPRKVVLKELHRAHFVRPELQDRFVNEARAMATLDHPNIVAIHDLHTPEESGVDDYLIVMEYMPGGSLDGWLRKGKLSAQERVRVVVQICRGLDCAHELGIWHRDVKPANVLMSKDGRIAKLSDWGLVHLPDASVITIGGQPGTPLYMSPEQAIGQETLDGRSDIYSVGAMLFEMVVDAYYIDFAEVHRAAVQSFERQYGVQANRLPARGINQGHLNQHVYSAYLEAVPTLPARRPSTLKPDISRDLEAVILTALEKDPRRRFQTAAAMADALERSLQTRPVDRTQEHRGELELLLQAAEQKLEALDYDTALKLLAKAQQLAARETRVYRMIARIHNITCRPDLAAEILRQGLKSVERAAQAALYHDLGFSLRNLGKSSEAVEAFRSSLELDPTQSDIKIMLRNMGKPV